MGSSPVEKTLWTGRAAVGSEDRYLATGPFRDLAARGWDITTPGLDMG